MFLASLRETSLPDYARELTGCAWRSIFIESDSFSNFYSNLQQEDLPLQRLSNLDDQALQDILNEKMEEDDISGGNLLITVAEYNLHFFAEAIARQFSRLPQTFVVNYLNPTTIDFLNKSSLDKRIVDYFKSLSLGGREECPNISLKDKVINEFQTRTDSEKNYHNDSIPSPSLYCALQEVTPADIREIAFSKMNDQQNVFEFCFLRWPSFTQLFIDKLEASALQKLDLIALKSMATNKEGAYQLFEKIAHKISSSLPST